MNGTCLVIHDDPKPTTTRCDMAFADAVFDGRGSLDGVEAVCVSEITGVWRLLAAREAIPVYVGALGHS